MTWTGWHKRQHRRDQDRQWPRTINRSWSLNCEDPARKDLLMDIGTEELSHLEVVGTLARLHLAPMKFKREPDHFFRLDYRREPSP
jgi:hypothetical protein